MGITHPARARLIIVTTPHPFHARAIMDLARRANPEIESIVRTHSKEEQEYLERNGAGIALIGERELALTMARHALRICEAPSVPVTGRPFR